MVWYGTALNEKEGDGRHGGGGGPPPCQLSVSWRGASASVEQVRGPLSDRSKVHFWISKNFSIRNRVWILYTNSHFILH